MVCASAPLSNAPTGTLGYERSRLTVGSDAPRIGFAQVQLEAEVSLVMALPALIDNLDSSLHYFGEVELSGYQVTSVGLEPNEVDQLADLVSALNWFGSSSRSAGMLVYGAGEVGLGILAQLQRQNTGPFEFGVPGILGGWDPPAEMVGSGIPNRPDVGLGVRLSDDPTAAGWVMAVVINAARTLAPNVTGLRLSLELQ